MSRHATIASDLARLRDPDRGLLLPAGSPLPAGLPDLDAVRPGEVVGIPVSPGGAGVAEVVHALLALWGRDAVAFPFAAGTPASTQADLLQSAGARWVLDPDRGLEATHVLGEPVATGPGLAIATSGSMGHPRVALHGMARFRASLTSSAVALDVGDQSAWLLSLPLYHVGGLAVVVRALATGGRVVLPRHRGTDGLITAILSHRPTHLSLVPTQLARLLAHGEAHARTHEEIRAALLRCEGILLGGGPTPTRLRREGVDLGLRLWVGYGSTESGSACAVARDPDEVVRPGAAGRALPGRTVAVDEEGEVLIGGEGLLAGYLGRGVLHDPREPDGTFATGDLGRLDPDGVLRILGRRDRRFTVGGENVHPEEVEGVLTDLPGILTAVVVPRNDEELGAVPVAFVRCDPLAGVTLDRVLEHLRERLERWKEPRDLWLLDDHDEVKPRPGAFAARLRDRSPRRRLRPLR